jgi:hypothetical protein
MLVAAAVIDRHRRRRGHDCRGYAPCCYVGFGQSKNYSEDLKGDGVLISQRARQPFAMCLSQLIGISLAYVMPA